MLVLLAVVIAACGEYGPTAGQDPPSTNSLSAPTALPPTTVVSSPTTFPPEPTSATSPTVQDGLGVAIVAIGTVVEDQRGLVVCPFEMTGPCPGLPLTGDRLPAPGDQVRLSGRYDGVVLSVSSIEPWTPREHGALTNPCTGNTNGIQAPEEAAERAGRILEDHPDRRVGMWVSDGQIVVAITGPDDELAEELGQIDDVCVATGYEHSAEALVSLVANEIDPLLADLGAGVVFGSVDAVPIPTIRVEGEAIDAATVDLLTDRYGDLVEFATFITVLDAPLSDLSQQQSAVPGDIVIPTEAARFGGAMAALWTGPVLEHDTELNCLYVDDGGGGRTVIVWPYGYTAVAGEPASVFDPAGKVVAETGVAFELGGGGGSVDDIDPGRRCAAESAWYTGGPTAYGWESRR